MENEGMTKEYLVTLPAETLADLVLHQAELQKETKAMNDLLMKKIETLQEAVAVMNQRSFGHKSEKAEVNPDQMTLDLGETLNEAEVLTENGIEEEPKDAVTVSRKKHIGKREKDLSRLDKATPEYHEITEAELSEKFPDGYTRLNDDVYYEVEHIRERYLLHEHHVAVYAGNNKEGIVRAEKPERLLKNSIVTPSLAAKVINEKYVNAQPLNRISEELARNNMTLSRQVLAGWVIRLSDDYLHFIEKEMWKELKKNHLIHCDETPFKVTEDQHDKSYMWVFHSPGNSGSRPVFLYKYDSGRNTKVLESSLNDFEGVAMTDGYQVYHSYEKQRGGELKVAGCWAHAKRKFFEITKALDKKGPKSVIAAEAVKRIQEIYHTDNMKKDASAEERLKHRTVFVQPLVDAYFAWIDDPELTLGMDKESKLYKAIQYSRNQERFLRVFLTDGDVPLDNNDAERSIRTFCVGKHNWHIAHSKSGANASGILYSIAETAKANGLRPYEYFKYVLEQFLVHAQDDVSSYIGDLLPWSEKIPDRCRKS